MAPNKKESISITVDREFLDWIDSQIEEHRFANRSHAVEYCLSSVKSGDEEAE